jgi:hypothetical protein
VVCQPVGEILSRLYIEGFVDLAGKSWFVKKYIVPQKYEYVNRVSRE